MQNPFRLAGSEDGGDRKRLAGRLFDRLVERLLGLHCLAKTYDSILVETLSEREVPLANHEAAGDFSRRVLKRFEVNWLSSETSLDRIPKSGAAILVANHPFGGLEGLILADLLSRVRTDFRLLANFLVARIPELSSNVIAVDPFADSSRKSTYRLNSQAYRQSLQWLEQGGILVMFPAGSVSCASSLGGQVSDAPWSHTAVRLACACGVPVIPVFFEGQNSRLFQWAGLVDPRLRTALLPREMLAKQGKSIQVAVGSALTAKRLSSFPDRRLATDYLRIRTYLQGSPSGNLATRKVAAVSMLSGSQNRSSSQSLSSDSGFAEPNATTVESGQLREEVACLESEQFLLSKGVFDFYCAPANMIPGVLQEIGRLREVTFQAAGEGTGNTIDLDQFDKDYMHLFAWNRDLGEVAGAYRLANTTQIVQKNGIMGLYTRSLFGYSADFLDRLGCALEMGRSFVSLAYQRSPEVLFGLWQGIGELVWRTPEIRTLFGTVSISRSYSNCSRQLIVEYLRRSVLRKDLEKLVGSFHPYNDTEIVGLTSQHYESLLTIEHLEDLIDELEGKDIPVLLRHYLRLGAEAIAFGVDPAFGDAVDILIAVDILRTELRRVERFMGRSRALHYLQSHGVNCPCQTGTPVCSAAMQERLPSRIPEQSTTSNR